MKEQTCDSNEKAKEKCAAFRGLLKYRFVVSGENYNELRALRDKLARSKAFEDAGSGMAITFVNEVE